MKLSVYRLHPGGCRIEKAEKTLKGTANKEATKWCVPYSTANAMGWNLYPPSDIDVIWKGSGSSPSATFEYRHLSEYSDYDHHYIKSLARRDDDFDPSVWCPRGGRTKYTFGMVESNVCQIWTGCIFKTPPDWCLAIRSPVNAELPHRMYNVGPICSVQEGLLETDWMQYDIWINLQFHVQGKWVYLRRNQKLPLAQVVPVHRSALADHTIEERVLERQTEEGEQVFRFWANYNHQKFAQGGKQRSSANCPEMTKDSTTFFREKKVACTHHFADDGDADADRQVDVVEVGTICPGGGSTQ